MAQTTYRYLVSDIQKQWNMNFPDSNVTAPQILYWCRVAENYIRQRSLKVTMTGSFLVEFQSVPVLNDTIRKWVVLPSQILDFEMEKGVDYVAYQTAGVSFGKQIRFQQTDVNVIDRLYMSPYESPSPSVPYFYRVGQQIFLLGIENISVANIQMGLYAAVDTKPNMIPIDSAININEEQIPSLKDIVFQYARLSMIVPKERVEVGTDDRNDNIKTLAAATKEQPQQ